MMIDVDDFKNINDIYGHQVGDKMLRYIADILKQNVRNSDICCKYGGDEFIVVLPMTGIKQAEIIGNRINNKLAEKPYILNENTGESITVSVSIGIAETIEDMTDFELIRCADKALYQAKSKGKKAVILYN